MNKPILLHKIGNSASFVLAQIGLITCKQHSVKTNEDYTNKIIDIYLTGEKTK